MKPSTAFANWIKANSARLVNESEDFQHTVATVSLTLEMIEMNDGLGLAATESALRLFGKFKTDAEARGYELPAIDMRKIKVVKPRGD